jgi:hypothetical protein
VAPDEDEKRLPLLILTLSHEGARGKSSPFRKGGKGEFDFYCSVIQTVSQSLLYTKNNVKVEDTVHLSSVFNYLFPILL